MTIGFIYLKSELESLPPSKSILEKICFFGLVYVVCNIILKSIKQRSL